MRLTGRTLVVIGALLGLIVIVATDQVVPAASQYQAQMRTWLVARAAGLCSYLLLTVLVTLGLILSHPVNQSTWKLSKRLFPWHENLLVFILAFLGAHIVSLILDPYAGVGIDGAFIPGLSSYRSVPVALGTLGLYALLVTGLTARYTKLLPTGWWLRLHRFSLLAWALAWIHSMLAGTDTEAFRWFYVATGLLVVFAASYRYWVSKKRRPTFATSLPEGGAAPAEVVPPVPRPRPPTDRFLRPTPGAAPGGFIAVPSSVGATGSRAQHGPASRPPTVGDP